VPSFEGVFVPVTTPLRGEDVATDRLLTNLRQWNATELSGYVVLGSTGEFPMLSERERDGLLVAAREAIPRNRTFLAGTGADSTLLTIRQTKRAAEIGADAALALIAARELCHVWALGRAGRWDEGKALAARMLAADRGVAGRYGIGGLKAALDLQGLSGGPCRAPLATPDGDAIEDIKEALATAGLL
jgi:dihydrodipicolinate synthase/N-acetylneuraminate lyase